MVSEPSAKTAEYLLPTALTASPSQRNSLDMGEIRVVDYTPPILYEYTLMGLDNSFCVVTHRGLGVGASTQRFSVKIG